MAAKKASKKIRIRPVDDRIVVKLLEAHEKTEGGIYLPDSAKEKPIEGEVVAAGPGKKAKSGKIVKPQVSVGDVVIISKWGGTEIKIDGVEYNIMRESDVLAVYTK